MTEKEVLERLLQVAEAAAKDAGGIVARLQTSPDLEVWSKADKSPTTNADREAEARMREVISAAYPEHCIYGEELGQYSEDSDSPYLWALDPIDGTWAFINQENTASVSLTVIKDGVPIVGVVHNPFTGETYKTSGEGESTLNGRVLPCARAVRREDVIGVWTYQLSRRRRREIDWLLNLWADRRNATVSLPRIGKLLGLGGSLAYALALVAKGAHDVYITCFSKPTDPWDISAGVLLVRNAGGQVTDLAGRELDPVGHKGYLVASARDECHARVLHLLAECRFGSALATE